MSIAIVFSDALAVYVKQLGVIALVVPGVLVRMVNSQALAALSFCRLSRDRQARKKVSCTRFSAIGLLLQIQKA